MEKAVKLCRVCGREYEACRSVRRDAGHVFRWQEVACSPECGAEYLRRVNESREPAPKTRHGMCAGLPRASDAACAEKESVPGAEAPERGKAGPDGDEAE